MIDEPNVPCVTTITLNFRDDQWKKTALSHVVVYEVYAELHAPL
jgi:hypothetical protein